MAEFDRCA